ncbi:GNAT family N-acetyltransferase [Lactobacillus sp. ESL0791]|uniref:GNAT family N-acetyltransferase n=1 Tax=Lactobacillus sp. ESL0791 TaxID=2983234 RepID=UPI0023F9E3FF|nr:GNAT family N-acetyltransferase [Lactobacillus sp. ESL0791]MDF7638310.1 GNAT family N-acetyltransferase [Lactobacillus sp. ESL0791]
MSNYRLNTTTDIEKFYHLYLYAFNAEDTPIRQSFFYDRCKHGLVYGIKQKSQLISALYSLPFKVDFHGVQYLMNGIGDVATAPENAGMGSATKLLQNALEDMEKNNITLSYLAPFSYEYYRRLGYEQVFNHLQYSLSNKDIPNFKPNNKNGKLVRGYLKNYLSQVSNFYSLYAQKGLKGGLIRASWWWEYLTIKNNWYVCLYFNEQKEAEGYVIYEITSSKLIVKEFIYLTNSAFENLLAFIFNHKNTVFKFVWDSPDPVYHGDFLANPSNLKAEIVPYMMVRIINIKNFLLKYPYQKKNFNPIRLKIEDKNLEKNSGIWQISSTNGTVKVNKLNDLSTDLTEKISIQELTKALFGSEKISNISKVGKTSIKKETIQELSQILIKTPPEITDYF